MLPLEDLVDGSLKLWRAANEEFPQLGRQYDATEQREREQVADACLDRVHEAIQDLRRRRLQPDVAQHRITAAVVELTGCALNLCDPYADWLLSDGFGGASTALARQARRLDARVSMIDILQAARNAWTTCGLQALFGCRVELTPAIFAYSMLYPYSDNYLDEPSIGGAAKLCFSARFRRRLSGGHPRPLSEREELIWSLVGMIEAQYPRAECPQVYESLLAIHAAQEESIRQMQRGGTADFDVLRLTFTKGGTSVLADACLALGYLSGPQAKFAFEWGVVLQLGDDLQDVRTDSNRGSRTLFSEQAGGGALDEITTRTLQFGRLVLAQTDMVNSGPPILSELLRRSAQLLLIRSAASAPELYSAQYLGRLERYSPFRFEFLRERESELARRKRDYGWLFEELIRIRGIETQNRVRTFRAENVLTQL